MLSLPRILFGMLPQAAALVLERLIISAARRDVPATSHRRAAPLGKGRYRRVPRPTPPAAAASRAFQASPPILASSVGAGRILPLSVTAASLIVRYRLRRATTRSAAFMVEDGVAGG